MTCSNPTVVPWPRQRRRLVQWVTAGVVLSTWAATVQAQRALSAAINVSGSFRAMSQRMAKAYFLMAEGVEPKASQAQMNADAADSISIESASLNLKNPLGLSLSKPCAALRQAQRERFKLIQADSINPP